MVTGSNPGQGRTEGDVRRLLALGSRAQEGHNGVAHTSSKEVEENISDFLRWQLDIGILVHALLLTEADQAVCDVSYTALGRESPQESKISNPDLPLHLGPVPHHP